MPLSLWHSSDGEVRQESDLEQIDALIANKAGLVWFDIDGSSDVAVDILRREFSFHELAVEDVQHRHQRPKIDSYESHAFMVLYAAEPATDKADTTNAVLNEVGIFIGPNYLVTVHEGPIRVLGDALVRWRRDPHRVGARASLLLHAIFDEMVDGYFPFADAIADRIEDLESDLFESFNDRQVRELFNIRRDLLVLRRTLSPTRDVALLLARRDIPFADEATAPYFEDVYDHVIRVTDSLDISRDLLTGALDTYLSITSNRLNQIMKTLTGASIILMSMALLAGIWGMNFKHMPELDWRLGYAFALAIMTGTGGTLFMLLRRNGYL